MVTSDTDSRSRTCASNPRTREAARRARGTVRRRRRRPAPSPDPRSARASPRSPGCCIRMRFAELDAVTVDGFGTLVSLVDPVSGTRGRAARAGHRARRAGAVRAAFAAEVAYYRPNGDSPAATRRAWPPCGSSAPASSSRRPAPSSTRRPFVDSFMARDRVRADPGSARRGRDAPAPRARARGRVELGRRARRAPRADRRDRPVLGTIVTSAEAGRAEARSGRVPPRSRADRRRARTGAARRRRGGGRDGRAGRRECDSRPRRSRPPFAGWT